MSTFPVISSREYSPQEFLTSVCNNTTRLNCGTVLEILSGGKTPKKVIFVFQSFRTQYCEDLAGGSYCSIEIGGLLSGGKGELAEFPLNEDFLGLKSIIAIWPDSTAEEKIKITNDNVASYFLNNTPKDITDLILGYLYKCNFRRASSEKMM